MEANWLNDKRFDGIHPKKKEYMSKMLNEIKGKSMNEGMKIFVRTNSEMKKEGLSLTKEEGNLMIEYLMMNMSSAEQEKWKKISAMLGR